MSAGNGHPIDSPAFIADVTNRSRARGLALSASEREQFVELQDRLIGVIPQNPRPLSATEREQQRLAYIAAVDNIARTLRETVKAVADLQATAAEQGLRIDAIERACATFITLPFTARLRWVLRGR